MNDRIRAREVRVIGDDGEQLGVMTVLQALDMARVRGLDLVEVQPQAVPPVCRLIDYGRFRYEQTKKERDARKNQKIVLLKEVRVIPKIAAHDLAVKQRAIEGFLKDGDRVKVSVLFRGREMAHPELGRALLESLTQSLKEFGQPERSPIQEGKLMTIILNPVHPGHKSGASQQTAAPAPIVPKQS